MGEGLDPQFADFSRAPKLLIVDLRRQLVAVRERALRRLEPLVPSERYLSGPTETNVRAYCEIPQTIAEDRTTPFRIGRACSHVKERAIHSNGGDLPQGREDELATSGAPVMLGYGDMPERTDVALQVDFQPAAVS